MKLVVLVDNHAGSITNAEHGLSYYIEIDQERKLLLDSGKSNLYLENALKLNVDIKSVNKFVLSHGHFDHGNGFDFLKQSGEFYCHPLSFVQRYRKTDRSFIGMGLDKDSIKRTMNIVETKEPVEIFKDVWFLGEIPRVTDFESKTTPFILHDDSPDFVMDDSAIAIKNGDKVFVITGCGHAGVVNTIEHAKNVTACNKIEGVAGGFHLKKQNEQTIKTINYLKDNNVAKVFPSHCTDLPAMVLFYNEFGSHYFKTGDVLDF